MESFLPVAICEDVDEDAQVLLDLIKKSGIPADCTIFESGEALLEHWQPGKFGLIFMDIYLKGMLGVDAVRLIRQTDESVVIAFITSSTDHALEGYRLDVLKYIEKPARLKEVADLMELALLRRCSRPSLNLLIDGRPSAIPQDRILYLEQSAHQVHIILSKERYHSNCKLSDLESQLPMPPFFRSHHSYLVNLSYVKRIDRQLSVFVMEDGSNVHIRRESMKKAKEVWEAFLFSRSRGQDIETD